MWYGSEGVAMMKLTGGYGEETVISGETQVGSVEVMVKLIGCPSRQTAFKVTGVSVPDLIPVPR